MKPPNCVISVLLFFSVAIGVCDEPKFDRQTIDGEIQIGYGVSIGRVDSDNDLDILLADKKEIVWYRNPGEVGKSWTKHVIARNLTARDNVCLAARDITGDGLVEIAVGANWNPSDTVNTETSGTSFYLQRPDDPTKPWKPIALAPHEPTTHRMSWLKKADGNMLLAVLPLHGVGNKSGAGRTVSVSLFEIADSKPALVDKVDTKMHSTHNFELLTDPEFGETEFMLIAGAEGYVAAGVSGESTLFVDSSISKGAGEVRRYPTQDRVFVGIEPMHGTDVVMYREHNDEWDKEIIDTTLSQGHALAAGNLFGSDEAEVVAGWRGPDANKKVGIKCYTKGTSGWNVHVVDDNQIACEDLKLADLDSDGQLDIIGAGRKTENLVVYWNRSE